jgi:hypothetical protein
VARSWSIHVGTRRFATEADLAKTFSLAAASILLAAAAFGATPPSKSKVHGLSVTGSVVSLDEPAKKMTVKTNAGKQIALVWTDATKTAGGPVKSGLKVTVRYLEKDGKNIATSIQVVTEKPATAAASASPTATATTAPRSP